MTKSKDDKYLEELKKKCKKLNDDYNALYPQYIDALDKGSDTQVLERELDNLVDKINAIEMTIEEESQVVVGCEAESQVVVGCEAESQVVVGCEAESQVVVGCL